MTEVIAKVLPRRRNRQRKADKVLGAIDKEKEVLQIHDPPSYKQISKVLDRTTMKATGPILNKKGDVKMTSNQLDILLGFVEQATKGRSLPYLETLVGRKFMKNADQNFNGASSAQQRKMLEIALADDFGASSLVTGALKYAAPHALKYVWDSVKERTPIKKIRSWLKDTLGFDMNDDLQTPRYNYNASPIKNIDWQNLDEGWLQRSLQFNGVAVQAICSILFPEYTSCRIPSDSSIKTGLYNRVVSTTITTNASGNAIFVLNPNSVFASGGSNQLYYRTYNGADLDINTGVQTANATGAQGPLQAYAPQASQFRVTATAVELSYITSPLNTQGRVVGTMYNTSAGSSLTTAPTGLDSIRDREYVTYTSMPQINGHRFVYINNDLIPGEFSSVTAAISSGDVIEFIISGAVASTAVLQVNIYFQVELIVQNSLADIGYPPAGPATQMALKEILRMPRLRLLGHQEATELYEVLASSEPTYEAVLGSCRGIKFNHKHDFVGFGGSAASNSISKQDFMNAVNMPILATE